MGKGPRNLRNPHRKQKPAVGRIHFCQPHLREIASKAKRSTSYRIGGLYSLLNPSNLTASFLGLNKKAARGSAGVTYAEYGSNLQVNIGDMVQKLKDKRYRAKMARRVHIPKGEGKTRPLGSPAVSDKVLQSCAANILSGINECDFLPCSFGYRPHRGAKEAVMAVREGLRNRTAWVVEADIRGFFDNIDHDCLVKMLEQRVSDKAFLGPIRKWLKAGILEADGNVANPESGTPQGGIISPVLANIYPHYALDLRFEKVFRKDCGGTAFLVRLRTSLKRLQKSLAAFTAWVKERRNKRLRTLFFGLNPKSRGYYRYFGATGNWHSLERFHEEVVRTLFRRLNRRSQKRSFDWKGFAALMSHYGMERPRITWGREGQSCMSLA
jgi:RNA-directed DNA polymerase